MKTPSHSCYVSGCGHPACQLEHYRYMKRWRMGQRNTTIPGHGTRRRLQALQAIGWTHAQIAEAGGVPSAHLPVILRTARADASVWTSTARAVAAAYDKLSMTPGPSVQTTSRAKQKGWLPPLAWDDDTIDDPEAEPYRPRPPRRDRDDELGSEQVERQAVDEIVVERALRGQPVDANPTERTEITSRWAAAGRPLNDLERIQGWNARRYLLRSAA